MNMLRDATEWVSQQMLVHCSQEITYSRGSDSVTLDAVIGRTTHAVTDDYGAAVITETKDFIVAVADFLFDGSAVTPERGDTITEVDGSTTHTYKVSAPSGEPHYRYSDPDRTMIRIHAVHVDEE